MKLFLVIVLSSLFGWLLCYGALRTAEKLAAAHTTQIEQIENVSRP